MRKDKGKDNITAIDYINQQTLLEKTASELMPYDPNTCSYTYGPIRQILFACITCYNNDPSHQMNGICYSCSIQCHHDHELVELFTKREFCCDCGTTRMPSNGCCKLRYAPLKDAKDKNSGVTDIGLMNSTRRSSMKEVWKEIKAEDIPSSSNTYGQNFKGLFCSCHKKYNPSEETGNMIQCNFGVACNEEWYHEECILGLKPGMVDRFKKSSNINKTKRPMFKKKFEDGVNVLDMLPEAEDEAANTSEITKELIDEKELKTEDVTNNKIEEERDPEPLEGFPDFEEFEGFICWKCINRFKPIFDEISKIKTVCLDLVYHIEDSKSLIDRLEKVEQPLLKKSKSENNSNKKSLEYSLFLKDDYQITLKNLFIVPEKSDNSKVKNFLLEHKCLYDDDPIYEPPEDEDLKSESSIFELGNKVLETLPREQAIEGAQAYLMIKNKLTEFLKPFAENDELVTEDKIRSFFDGVNEKMGK